MSKQKAKKVPSHWMPLMIGDYLADTAHLNTEQHGAYLLMLMHGWRNGAKLPCNDSQLAAISKLGPKKWKLNRDVLLAFFEHADGYLFHAQQTADYAHALSVYQKRVTSGRLGGAPKGKSDDRLSREPNGYPNGYPNGTPDDSPEWVTEGRSLSPPQPQPQPHLQEASSSSISASGRDLKDSRAAMQEATKRTADALTAVGCPDCHAHDPRLAHILQQGIPPEELIALAGTTKGRGKGLAYLIKTVCGQRKDAEMRAAPAATPVPEKNSETARLDAARRECEDAIIEARHFRDRTRTIDATECDRRIAAAKEKYQATVGETTNVTQMAVQASRSLKPYNPCTPHAALATSPKSRLRVGRSRDARA